MMAYLFGSRAKNTASENSDWDIALVLARCNGNLKVVLDEKKLDVHIFPTPAAAERFLQYAGTHKPLGVELCQELAEVISLNCSEFTQTIPE